MGQNFGITLRGVILAVAFSAAAPAYGAGDLWGYFKRYQLGVDYTNSNDTVDITYELPANRWESQNCEPKTG